MRAKANLSKFTPELSGGKFDGSQATWNLQNQVQQLYSSVFGGNLTPIYPITVVSTTSYQLKPSDVIVNLTSQAGAPTVLLPTARAVFEGQVFTIKDSTGAGFTLMPVQGEKIDNGTSYVAGAYVSVHLTSTGTGWIVL